jgi:hypothetical protein
MMMVYWRVVELVVQMVGMLVAHSTYMMVNRLVDYSEIYLVDLKVALLVQK